MVGFDKGSANGANGFQCVICRGSICYDSAEDKTINLKCGHAFGRSCMRKWVESSKQKKCLLCTHQLTVNELKKIKDIPLQERLVITLEKTYTLFGRTILNCATGTATTQAVLAAGVVAAVVAAAATGFFGNVGPATGAARGVTGAAVGAAVMFSSIVAAVAAGAAGAASEVDRSAARTIGAAVGAAVGSIAEDSAGDFGLTVTAIGFAAGALAGAIVADAAYDEQEMNPVVL
ncbi:hypothetical protein J7438_13890 [Thalassotalea sp. G20_0]|nr:hypothetical protein [Thalassotalea sp. G20_0]